MSTALERILEISSGAIVSQKPDKLQITSYFKKWHSRGSELEQLISTRNGFWTYESSLLVRPFSNSKPPLGIIEWNDENLWKSDFDWDLNHILCFAEDLFGCQFCIVEEKVCLFDPETGQLENFANSLQDWAMAIIGDFEFRTGYPLAHAWQIKNSILIPGSRLLPKIPFALGGKYDLENLYASKDVDGMIFRANIANQIRNISDGEKIIIDIMSNSKGGTSG